MEASIKQTIWKQFGAAIDMLENALLGCPDDLWNTSSKFWYKAFHCIFFLDYYLSSEPENFTPPAPFTLSEFDPAGIMPERAYTKEELIIYIQFCRMKCYNFIEGLSEEKAAKRWVNSYRNYSMTEILIYNMRHVQHHAAQLNLLLRQNGNKVPNWVSQTLKDL